MATRMRAVRSLGRSFSTAAERMDKAATKGPKLPPGNDPSAYHSPEAAKADANRWRWIAFMFGVPVLGFGILQAMGHHDHNQEQPEVTYPYQRIAAKTPRFPWGNDDLFGTPADRHAKKEGKSNQ